MAETTFGRELPEEIEGDYFDRQRVIPGWNHDLIEEQTCFVLGVGGLGCTIALTLCRLGVKKIFLLDRDVVDASNLNRQILFSKDDVGRNKVDAAVDGLACHNLRTELVPMHMDALVNWSKIVEVASECTVIFNNIDVGEACDYALVNLCKHFQIPYAAGSSYARTWIAEFYTGRPEHDTFTTVNGGGMDAELKAKLQPDTIATHDDLTFLPHDDNPPTRAIGSNALVCCTASIMCVNAWVQTLMGDTMPNWMKMNICMYDDPTETLAFPHPEAEPAAADDS